MSRPADQLGTEKTRASRESEPSVVGTDMISEATISPRIPSQKKELRLLASLFTLELSLAVVVIALYMGETVCGLPFHHAW